MKNAKVEPKSSWETILEAVETDFASQDSDFGGQDADFGGQKKKGQIVWGLLGENGGMRKAYSEARLRRVQLEYRKVPYAGHP